MSSVRRGVAFGREVRERGGRGGRKGAGGGRSGDEEEGGEELNYRE